MKRCPGLKFLVFVFLLVSLGYPDDIYTVGPKYEGDSFFIENDEFTVSDIHVVGIYSTKSNRCVISNDASYAIITHSPFSMRDRSYNLSKNEDISFSVSESSTGYIRTVSTYLTLKNISAGFTETYFDDVWYCIAPSSVRATFEVQMPSEVYYCSDSDAEEDVEPQYLSEISNAGILTTEQISSLTGNILIDVYPQPNADGQLILEDSCLNATHLQEWACDGGVRNGYFLEKQTIECSYSEICSSGTCQEATDFSCTDSDNGLDLATAGTTTRYKSNAAGDVTALQLAVGDSCSVDRTRIVEYVCDGDVVSGNAYDCPEGTECIQGACTAIAVPEPDELPPEPEPQPEPQPSESETEPFCYDNDNGENIVTRGTTQLGERDVTTLEETITSQYEDQCVSQTVLTEYYCSEDALISRNITCSEGTVCNEGSCIVSTGGPSEDGERNDSSSGTAQDSEPVNEAQVLAEERINEALNIISVAEQLGKNVTAAQEKLELALDAFESGDYGEVILLVEEVKALAIEGDEQPVQPPSQLEPEPQFDQNIAILLAILIILGAVLYFYLKNRQLPPKKKISPEQTTRKVSGKPANQQKTSGSGKQDMLEDMDNELERVEENKQ